MAQTNEINHCLYLLCKAKIKLVKWIYQFVSCVFSCEWNEIQEKISEFHTNNARKRVRLSCDKSWLAMLLIIDYNRWMMKNGAIKWANSHIDWYEIGMGWSRWEATMFTFRKCVDAPLSNWQSYNAEAKKYSRPWCKAHIQSKCPFLALSNVKRINNVT